VRRIRKRRVHWLVLLPLPVPPLRTTQSPPVLLRARRLQLRQAAAAEEATAHRRRTGDLSTGPSFERAGVEQQRTVQDRQHKDPSKNTQPVSPSPVGRVLDWLTAFQTTLAVTHTPTCLQLCSFAAPYLLWCLLVVRHRG
jgi:hypothetical protein